MALNLRVLIYEMEIITVPRGWNWLCTQYAEDDETVYPNFLESSEMIKLPK